MLRQSDWLRQRHENRQPFIDFRDDVSALDVLWAIDQYYDFVCGWIMGKILDDVLTIDTDAAITGFATWSANPFLSDADYPVPASELAWNDVGGFSHLIDTSIQCAGAARTAAGIGQAIAMQHDFAAAANPRLAATQAFVDKYRIDKILRYKLKYSDDAIESNVQPIYAP